MQLEGKTVVVTGGARGLGRAYCESLATEGANVVAADIRDTQATVDSVTSTGGRRTLTFSKLLQETGVFASRCH